MRLPLKPRSDGALADGEVHPPKGDCRVSTGLYGNTVLTVTDVESCVNPNNDRMPVLHAAGIFCFKIYIISERNFP